MLEDNLFFNLRVFTLIFNLYDYFIFDEFL